MQPRQIRDTSRPVDPSLTYCMRVPSFRHRVPAPVPACQSRPGPLPSPSVEGMTTINLVVGILVLAFVIYRQLIARPVRDNFRLPLLLGIIGLIELIDFLK